MDAEMLVGDYLNGLGLGFSTYLTVPGDLPDEFASIVQTGGASSDLVVMTVDVDIDCWALTRARSAEMADAVWAALVAMPEKVEDVFHARITASYRDDDIETKRPRHAVSVQITYAR